MKKMTQTTLVFYTFITCLGLAMASVQDISAISKSNYLETRDFYLDKIIRNDPNEVVSRLARSGQDNIMRSSEQIFRYLKQIITQAIYDPVRPFDPLEEVEKAAMVNDPVLMEALEQLARDVRARCIRRERMLHALRAVA